jgi:hypothetical protein
MADYFTTPRFYIRYKLPGEPEKFDTHFTKKPRAIERAENWVRHYPEIKITVTKERVDNGMAPEIVWQYPEAANG